MMNGLEIQRESLKTLLDVSLKSETLQDGTLSNANESAVTVLMDYTASNMQRN